MPRKKKPFNLSRKIVVHLRAIHRSWPPSRECIKAAKVDKNKFRCEACDKLFRQEYLRRDHIDPIGEEPRLIEGQWTPTWDFWINSLFSPVENYQALCLDCHDLKTRMENKLRKAKR